MPEEVSKALEEAELGSDCLSFPLSLGEPRADVDHLGQACVILDCVFNSHIIKQAESHRLVVPYISPAPGFCRLP